MWKRSLSLLLLVAFASEASAQCRPSNTWRQPNRRVVSRCVPTANCPQTAYRQPATNCYQSSRVSASTCLAPQYSYRAPSHCPTVYGPSVHVQGQVFSAPYHVYPGTIASVPHCNCPRGANVPMHADGTPYSLAGQARPDTGKILPSICEITFLACCEGGGIDCLNEYLTCAQAAGEPIRHLDCPFAPPPPIPN